MRTKSVVRAGVAGISAALLAVLPVGIAQAADDEVGEPSEFTSTVTTMATPDMVVDMEDEAAPGEPGSSGTFTFRINSDEEIICYDITLEGVTTPYESPARTATHIHEATPGTSGPPRLAFPDPEDAGDGMLRSEGCMQGPFTTGVTDDDDMTDTGEGFTLAQIEAEPEAFFADTHTEQYTDGAVRGQLSMVPMGGVETGAGATADNGSATGAVLLPLGVLAVAGAGAGLLLLRNHTADTDR